MKPEISKEILIEDLIDNYSFSVRYLMEKGIRCIMCGEPIWGTLEEAALEKGFTETEIVGFASEMNEIAQQTSEVEDGEKPSFNFAKN